MNPVVESLLGFKAFNDQFIAEDLLQDNRQRMGLLLDCLKASTEENLMNEIILQIKLSIQLEQHLLQLGLIKDWLAQDTWEQLGRDLKWAYKAPRMIQKK
ncbi:hypothetical protein P4H66_11075 [Paenibacillus dokdonensis]|uniref:Uncharacterized protein n=1 Tax=Paenibacillus dokdonensis TaxID=2567944 RepID=A0ABU6GKZ9_9BACL|nr:hypothetical protein [Paenibacillus dokdonensis]MEC0240393.1 hypothetical protein [Paenibacillus dokdonensis]